MICFGTTPLYSCGYAFIDGTIGDNRKRQAMMETSTEVPGFITRPEHPGGHAGRPYTIP